MYLLPRALGLASVAAAAVISKQLQTGTGNVSWTEDYSLTREFSVSAEGANVLNRLIGTSSVPYGTIITTCSSPGMIAFTFDDGPGMYTESILDLLDEHGAKATFFMNGVNFGDILGHAKTVQRARAAGHQIGSHTYTHPSLNSLDSLARREDMLRLERAMETILDGKRPTYMRPPFGECDSVCQADMGDLGYHVVNWNVDTRDWANNDPWLIRQSVELFAQAVSADPREESYIVLSHDVKEFTATDLVPQMLQIAADRGYRLVTVGECLGDPEENWYTTSSTVEDDEDDEDDDEWAPIIF